MDKKPWPAVLPAIGFLLGSVFAVACPIVSVPLLGGLAAAGIAAGGELGVGIVGAAAGALSTEIRWLQPGRHGLWAASDRPVELEAVATGHPVRGDHGWTETFAVQSIRQAGRLGSFADEVRLLLPAELRPPPLGTSVLAAGYLRRSPGYANDPPAPGGDWRLGVKVAGLLRELDGPSLWLAFAGGLRTRFDRATVPGAEREPGIALARALLVGDTSGIPDDWRRALRRSGLLHLLAVSGFNVSLLLGAVWLSSTWLKLRWRLCVAGAVVTAYVATVGPLASVLRAGAMGVLLLLALLLRRPPVAANAVAVALVAVLGIEPRLIGDLGFQLTFAATAGLVYLAPKLAAAWHWIPAWIGRPLAATWSAQLATLPWALGVFHQTHPGAFLFNLLFVPLAAAAMLGDLAWAVVACLWPAAGGALHWLPALLALPFEALTLPPAGPWFVVPVARRDALAVVAACAAVTWCLGNRRRLGMTALLVFGLWCGHSAGSGGGSPRGPLQVEFFDVGQGDAALVRDGDRALLIDGGGWQHGDFGGTVLLAALANAGVHRLDAMAMTHSDSDHCRGLVDLADYLPVEEVWMGASQAQTACARALAARVARVRIVAAGDGLDVGRWLVEVLGPPANARGLRDNDASVVLRASALARRFLFTGDVEVGAERRLLAAASDRLVAEVLKVAHHGSRTSSSAPFLAAVRPGVAVVSVGRANRFGHPDAGVLTRLETAGARLLRTDRDGQIVFTLLAPKRWRIELPATPRVDG